MVSVSNNYNTRINPSVSSAQAVQKNNNTTSIFTEGKTPVQNDAQASLYQKLETEVKALLNKYEGITFENLLTIQKELKLDKVKTEELTEEKIQKFVKFVKEKLDASVVDGKVDLEKLKAGIKDGVDVYNFLNKGLIAMLVQKGFLSESALKNAKCAKDIDPKVLEDAVTKFVTSFVDKIKKEGLNVKEKEQILQQLIAGTSDEDRAVVWDAVKKVLAENKMVQQAIAEFLTSYVTPQKLQEFIDKLSKEDLNKLGINLDEFTTALKDCITNHPEKFQDIIKGVLIKVDELKSQYGELFKKIQEYKQQNPDNDITDEVLANELGLSSDEIEKFHILSNLHTMVSGLIIGGNLTKQSMSAENEEFFNRLFDSYSLSDIHKRLEQYLQNHSELELSQEDLTSYMDKLTKGEYSGNTEAYQNAEEKTAQSSDGIGLNPTELANNQQSRLVENPLAAIKELYQQYGTEEKQTFTVEKSVTKEEKSVSFAGKTAGDIEEDIKTGVFKSTTEAVCMALKKYKDLSGSAKQWVTDKLGTMSKTYQKYIFKKGLAGSVIRFLAKKKFLKSEDLENTGATREQKEEVKRQEEKRAA